MKRKITYEMSEKERREVRQENKKYETGVKNVAMSNNEAAVLRKLHGQNGNFGDNLEQVPLIGKGLSSAMNNIQGWGKAQYARNESIADRNMNRLSQQSWGLQEQFRPTGMRNAITNTQFGNQDYNDLEDTQNNTARKGKESVKDKALIEVEKDELIFRKNGNSPYKLVGDMIGGKTHEQGGEKVVAKEGDVIFPGKDRNLVLPLINNDGVVVNNNKFQKLRSRLPEDKPSNLKQEQTMARRNPNGKIIGTGMSFEKGGSVPTQRGKNYKEAVKEALRETSDYWKGKAPFKQIGKVTKPITKALSYTQPSTYIKKLPLTGRYKTAGRVLGAIADLGMNVIYEQGAVKGWDKLFGEAAHAASELHPAISPTTMGDATLDNKPVGKGQYKHPETGDTLRHKDLSRYEIDEFGDVREKLAKLPDKYPSNYTKDLAARRTISGYTPPYNNSSNTNISIPRPRYSELHSTGVIREGLQLEPTNAEISEYSGKGSYDLFKYKKIKELKDKGIDLSKYEGDSDLETFYNLYHDKKGVKDKEWTPGKVKTIRPFKVEDYEELNNDESRPPSIMRQGTRRVIGSRKHELEEMKDFKKIDSILSSLESMHKDITSNYKKKAEYGMRSVNADPYATPQSYPQNPYNNKGVQGAVNNMSNQSDTMPVFNSPMSKVQSQQPQMPLSSITPTMPTLGEPAITPAKPKSNIGDLFNSKGFKSTSLGNSNRRRFSFYHGMSRQGGDEYTDRYTNVNGGGNVNQYEFGIKGVKGSANNQAIIKGGGAKAPEKRVQRGVTKKKIEVPGTSQYAPSGDTYKGPQATSYDINAIQQQHLDRFKGNKELYDFYNSDAGKKHLLTAGGFDIAPPKLTTTPSTIKEIEVPTETITETPGESGQATIGQSSSASDATGNNNSTSRSTDMGDVIQGGYTDLSGATTEAKNRGTSRQDRKLANKEMRVEARGQKVYARGLNNAYKELEKRDDYKNSSFEQQMTMRERLRDVYHKGNEHWLQDKGLAEKAYSSSATRGFEGAGGINTGNKNYNESETSVGSHNTQAPMSKQAVEKETSEPVNPSTPAPGVNNPSTVNSNSPTNNNGTAVDYGINSSANSDVSNNTTSNSSNEKEIGTPPNSQSSPNEDERMRRLGIVTPKMRYGSKRVIGVYEGGGTVKKDGINSQANSNVHQTAQSTSGNKKIINFGNVFKGKPEETKPEETKPTNASVTPGKVGDFNMPDWKKLSSSFDPAMSADDVVAGKVNLNRQNYQDTSNPQRQQIHSLMGGGGFDVGGQLAQEADKVRALDQVNAGEQQKLADINKGNTDILNQEKMANFDQLTSAHNAFEQNKGTVEAANYEALMRNNRREEDRPMKEMNYNMSRANYAAMEPMIKAQMEQMRMANEYMAKKANEETTTPVTTPAPVPAPSPAPFNNPHAGTSQGGSKVSGGADMVPEASPNFGTDKGVKHMEDYFLKNIGLVKRKGSKKIILSKKSR